MRNPIVRVRHQESPAARFIGPAVYLCSWAPLLMSSRGKFWDDWVLFGATPIQLITDFRDAGLTYLIPLHLGLRHFGAIGYSVVALAVGLLSVIALDLIIGQHEDVRTSERVFAVSVFAAVPLMAARNTAIVLPYLISLTSLMWASYQLIRPGHLGATRCLGSAALIAVASLTPSVALFAVGAILYGGYIRFCRDRGSPDLRFLALMLLIPPLAVMLPRILNPPQGVYVGYRVFEPEMVIGASVRSALVLLGLWMMARIWRQQHSHLRSGALLVLAGLLVASLALLPYEAIGQDPPFSEWATRHELLLPIASAIAALGLARVMGATLPLSVTRVACVGIVATMAVQSISIGLDYRTDWKKQEKLVELLAANPAIASAEVILFDDDTDHLNIFGRMFRYYEWNGLLREALGDQERFGTSSWEDVEILLQGGFSGETGPDGNYRGAGEFLLRRVRTLAIVKISGSLDNLELSVATLALTRGPSGDIEAPGLTAILGP